MFLLSPSFFLVDINFPPEKMSIKVALAQVSYPIPNAILSPPPWLLPLRTSTTCACVYGVIPACDKDTFSVGLTKRNGWPGLGVAVSDTCRRTGPRSI